MDRTLFWEAAKNLNHPKHNLALAAVQNIKNRQAENGLQTKQATGGELTTKTVKFVTEVREAGVAESRSSLGIDYEKAAAEAVKKVKQDLATRETEQRLNQEIERQKRNETLSMTKTVRDW